MLRSEAEPPRSHPPGLLFDVEADRSLRRGPQALRDTAHTAQAAARVRVR